MKSAIIAATVLALGVSAQSSVKINTPTSLVVCQPIKISWSGGVAPYYVSAIPGGQASAAPLKDFGKVDGNELTWNVDLAAGTSISMQVKDSNGDVNYAQAVNVQAGSDTSCLNAGDKNVSAGGAAAGGAASSPSPAAAGGAAGSSAAASGSDKPAAAASSGGAAAASGSASKPAASSGSAAPSTSAPSSAGRVVASTGIFGAAALFLAAFL